MKDLNVKIWSIKKKLPVLRKETDGFNFKYVDLEDIEKALIPLLDEYKLGIQHYCEIVGDPGVFNTVKTVVFDLSNPSDEMVACLAIPESFDMKGQNPIQAIGSAITYFKRYNIVSLFDILGTEKDADTPPTGTQRQAEVKAQATSLDYIAKAKSLIAMGRKKPNMERYFNEYQSKMSEAEKATLIEMIKTMKE